MPDVTRNPAEYAIQWIVVLPSDVVLRDRFGAAASERTFVSTMDQNILTGRQWYHESLEAGKTFTALPSMLYRFSKTEAQIRADYQGVGDGYYRALKDAAIEMAGRGLIDPRSTKRFYQFSLAMYAMPGAGNAVGGPFFNPGDSAQEQQLPYVVLPGAVVGADKGAFLLGGLAVEFLALGTVVSPPNPAATGTSLSVSPVDRLKFAVAAHRFAPGGTRLTGSVDTVTQTLNVESVAQFPAAPFDAVLCPWGARPTPENGEAVRVTAVGVNQVTVTRAQYGTTARAFASGSMFAPRQTKARVFSASGQPEDPDREVVTTTLPTFSTSLLTIVRGQADSLPGGGGNTVRQILTTDRIAAMEPDSQFFQQTTNQIIGGAMHEVGHGLGGKFWSPKQLVAGEAGPGESVRDYAFSIQETSGYFQHLPHTPDNPITPGVVDTLMMNWWEFPNYPSTNGWTANERVRVLASPFITTQARPTDVASGPVYGFYGDTPPGGLPTGGAGDPPPPPPPANGYVVNPIAFWASDTSTNTSTFPASLGYTIPQSESSFLLQMEANILEVRRYFWDRMREGTSGYTFTANPSRMWVSPTSTAGFGDPNPTDWRLISNALTEVDAGLPGIDRTDKTQLNFLIIPIETNIAATGQCFDYHPTTGDVYLSLNGGDPPFFASMWGQATGSVVARMGTYFGSPPPSGPDQQNQIGRRTFAHELAHAFGYNPATKAMLAHSATAGNLMRSFMDVGTFTQSDLDAAQIALLKASPFMSLHATRP